ncbi:MAG: tetratricopeptide repeat protein [Bacteroidota bacterium]
MLWRNNQNPKDLKLNFDISPEQLERFDAYLNDQMDDQQKKAFEQTLENDSALQAQFDDFREMVLGIEQSILSKQLDTFHLDMEEAENPPTRKIYQLPVFKYLAAACIGLLIVTIGWMLSSDVDHSQFVADTFKPDPGLPTLMGVQPAEGDSYKYDFNKAMVDYKFGRYDDAIDAWNALLKNQPQSDTLNYFLGVSHLAIGAAQKAQPHFEVVIDQNTSVFLNEAYWYYSLALMADGQIKAAKESLQQTEHPDKKLILDRLNE